MKFQTKSFLFHLFLPLLFTVLLLFSCVDTALAASDESGEDDYIMEPVDVPADGLHDSDLYATSAILLDADFGRVLYSKNGDAVLPMASTTKIMTCIVALEQASPDLVCTVSSYAASQPKVHLGIKAGQEYYLKDLLYSLMLESHNDSAVAIAEGVSGSVEAFAELMNQKAAQLNLTETHFVTPNGLDAEGHFTTARELALIMRYCINSSPKKEDFLAITRASVHSFTDISGKVSHSCNNHNALLTMMDGAISGKTGFTGKAGYCYVGAVEQDGETLIVALLACGWPNNKNYKWTDTRKLMKYGFEFYAYKDIFQPDITLPDLVVEHGQYDYQHSGQATTSLSLNLPEAKQHLNLLVKDAEQVRTEVTLSETITAPATKGDVAGAVTYYLGDEIIQSYPVYVMESVDEIDFLWCIKRVFAFAFTW